MKKSTKLLIAFFVALTVLLTVTVVSGVIAFAATTPEITISVEKTVFAPGEDIKVTYSGLAATRKGTDIELRMDLNGNTSVASSEYIDLCLSCKDHSTELYRGESATVSFKDDNMRGNFSTLKAGSYTIQVFQYSPTRCAISNVLTVTIAATTVSTDKLVYTEGEPIEVSFTSFTGYTTAEIRLDNAINLDAATYTANRKGSTDYVLCTNFMTAGKAKFPADGARKIAKVPAGHYTVWVMTYSAAESLSIISNKVEITVNPVPTIQITTDKTEYTLGEDVVVTFSEFTGLTTAEIRIDNGHDLSILDYPANRKASKDYALCSSFTATKTVTFPDDGVRSIGTLPVGDYTIWVMTYPPTDSLAIVSNKIEITVVGPKPKLELDKTKYTVGDDVVVTFTNITADLAQNGQNVEVRLYKKGDVVGTNASIQYIELVSSAKALAAKASTGTGTITFPSEGGRTSVAGLTAGDYYVVLLNGNTQIGDAKIEFTVENVPTGDFSLALFAIPTMLVMALAFVAIKKKSEI